MSIAYHNDNAFLSGALSPGMWGGSKEESVWITRSVQWKAVLRLGLIHDEAWKEDGLVLQRNPLVSACLALAGAVAAAVGIPSAALAGAPPTVAVVEFTNKTGRDLLDIDIMATELLATLLAETGQVQVVDREKLNHVIREQSLILSGLVDQTSTAVQVGRLIGADWLVTGALLSVESVQTKFSGYGFTSEQTVFKLTGAVRALNVTTGKVEFARVLESQRTFLSTSYLQVKPADVERELVRDFLEKAVRELVLAITASSPAEPAAQVLVHFESVPAGAEVEVDGLYVGITPLDLRLTEGVHQVVIAKGGFRAWEKRIQAYEGLKVSVTLAPETYEKAAGEE